MGKKKDFITEKNILEIISLIRKQTEKDDAFGEAMAQYAPESKGCVFGMNDFFYEAINKMWCFFIEEYNKEDVDEYSWLDWYVFECDLGKKEMSAYIDKKEYKIKDDKSFAKFILTWRKLKK